MEQPLITAIFALASLGILSAAGLGIAARYFSVVEDPLLSKIAEALPGANCGACGFPGCVNYAHAILGNKSDINLCAPGGNATVEKIAALLGKEASVKEREVARVRCFGHCSAVVSRSAYTGVQTCKAADLLNGGQKECSYGCLGLGDCVKACPFGAMIMGENGLPSIDEEKCTGCGICALECPKRIITLEKKKNRVILKCSSPENARVVRKACAVGCTACGLCAKSCPHKALSMQNNLPVWDWSMCENCTTCSEVCPRDIIFFDGAPIPKAKKKSES
ncbi:MAG: hypothetical protein A2268_09520 [Candidatus Raymondbacteria bacterium RifOxyA12_full_50_37]|uniref:Ion-translocating oxidoreductase complex subunit B n=1 Tax=Candidatus Raymondbacteria bacterium RIFOXYD12_FULL_49_13 TaxID=1817890 RepID=A0A1F7F1K1_UNCRA|nr:MAG: hypothetical protein A2268_09520 [Candidatus Raymondbacteria bacterium RifOxyA12_full_50_37]OGJ93129.1 MAG: hypothetical protein A2350_17710 [Candidatus Raymondbacteria bacterium RifOxyB12_full_50_8]OGJ93921.1 MAG: hypothetical protein A2248_06775 [Candidatus Raymondbacteria bacterium RIFOXYA2_FULL_49_16]OGJ98210.1 MAG: hypothetical protein A2453_00390 [Candidatus Raymondbacteria bacterium RIFOXYC2_FULL_50_21]OGK00443.1 MAG: hypothetical protein A2519_10565 [Candidatus Raymondbacteria b